MTKNYNYYMISDGASGFARKQARLNATAFVGTALIFSALVYVIRKQQSDISRLKKWVEKVEADISNTP